MRFYSDYVNTDQHNFFLLRVIWIVDEVLIAVPKFPIQTGGSR